MQQQQHQIRNVCSYCRMPGHNRRTCGVRRAAERVVEPAVVQPAVVEPAVVQPAVVQPAVVQPAVVQPAVVEPAVPVGLYYGLNTVTYEEAILYRNRILQSRFMTGMTVANFEYKFELALESWDYRDMVMSVSNVLLKRAHKEFNLVILGINNIVVASQHIDNYSRLVHNMLNYVKCIEKIIAVRIAMRIAHQRRERRIARQIVARPTTKTHLKKLQILRCREEETGHESTCTICMDELQPTNIIHTNCKHVYCFDCVSGYINSIKDKTCLPTCPMCRGKLDCFNTYSHGIHTELTNTIQAL